MELIKMRNSTKAMHCYRLLMRFPTCFSLFWSHAEIVLIKFYEKNGVEIVRNAYPQSL